MLSFPLIVILNWNDYSHLALITAEKKNPKHNKTKSFYIHSAKEQKYGKAFTKRISYKLLYNFLTNPETASLIKRKY